ncbi:MAG: NAD+ synthase [Verrucomicrobia bacterium]|nr:NAD+ synthase [Verrucomicrobiota bacterium]
MKLLLVALAQLDVAVGALAPNATKIIRKAREAAAAGAAMIVFPELALCGYPPEDLVLKRHFLDDSEQQIQRLARELPPEAIVAVGSPRSKDGKTYNSAVIFHGGREAACYHKMVLPNYGVFDEKRVFEPGHQALVLDADGLRIGVHICEDSWDLNEAAVHLLRDQDLDALVNLSASPYHRGKLARREDILRGAARFLDGTVLYANLVGGQDELVFDGASLAMAADGTLMARAHQFAEDILYVPVSARSRKSAPSPTPPEVQRITLPAPVTSSGPGPALRVEPVLEDPAEVYAALKLGLRDYVDKNGFDKVVVALSGGIDSALVATLACDALGRDRVKGVTMPSQYSSAETLDDAGRLAATLDIELFTLPIRRLYETFLSELAPTFEKRPPDVTEENLQARIRGNLVMALSNKFGWLVLTTGNKSELATGYCTLYGDMVGGFAVIKDVPKTLVFELARWRNAQASRPLIPPRTITRAPSAELRPNQKDTDSLPPYDRLDAILERYVELDESVSAIVAAGFEPATVRRVARLVDRSEYKRRQGAPGIKITPKAFGRDRRMPITNLYDERTEGESRP